jgi:hypothetical protein
MSSFCHIRSTETSAVARLNVIKTNNLVWFFFCHDIHHSHHRQADKLKS